MLREPIIRSFDGSSGDAEGLLAVEKATFDESPYSVEQIQAMLTGDTQRAWLAIDQGQVVGFVAAFAVHGLRGPCWEVDLLAVHPEWAGQGLATRLIRAATSHGRAVARRARAWTASDNLGSARAFARAGFHRAGTCELFIFRPTGHSLGVRVLSDAAIRPVQGVEELAGWLPEDMALPVPDLAQGRPGPWEQGGLSLLLAEQNGQPAGYAELIEVQTLLYRGVWIESLAASKQRLRSALIRETVNRAAAAGLDEIGMMVPEHDSPLREALSAAGFRSLGRFDRFTVGLPLPGPSSAAPSVDAENGQAEEDDA